MKLNSKLEESNNISTITATKGTKFNNNTNCNVKNGVCYVTLETIASEDVAHGDIVVSGLPKPYRITYLSLTLTNGNAYSAILKANGTLEIYYPTYKIASRIDATFSYLVAEE